MGRLGTPEEIASLAIYLASDESEFVTGITHAVDGGMHLLFVDQAVSVCHDLVHFSDGIGHNGRILSKTGDYTGEDSGKGGAGPVR